MDLFWKQCVTQPWFAWSLLISVSLLFGSFLNVWIVRAPLMLKRAWFKESQAWMQELSTEERQKISAVPERFNLCVPLSHCVQCKTPLKPYHNIPLISFMVLRGRCAFCKTCIHWRYPLVELLAALMAWGCMAHWGWSWQGFSAVVFCWWLLVMTAIDCDERLLPDDLTLSLLWLGLLLSTQNVWVSPTESLWGAAAGYVALRSVTALFNAVTGKQGMGGGDFKLFAALGAWMGPMALPLIIVLASVAGLCFGMMSCAIRRSSLSTPVPFGPFLAVSGMFMLVYKESALHVIGLL